MKVKPSIVLLIDQDTTEDVLYRRLESFANYMKSENCKQRHDIYVESQKGYSLSDGSLIKAVSDADADVVIIDSLISVSGDLDVNKTKDMAVLSELKRAAHGKTLIIIHHISEHANVTSDEVMTISDANKLTMGNSVINQQADTLFYLSSTTKSSLRDLNVRPVAKRVSLDTKPFVAELIESGNKNIRHFEFKGNYEKENPCTKSTGIS